MDTDLISFIRRVEPAFDCEIAGELHSLGEHGAGWPRASAEHWKREIERLVKEGKLEEANGMVSVAKTNNAKQQMSLFDL